MAAETFLVLGSNSFSGATFVASALATGAEVVGISRSPEPDEALLPYKWAPHDRFTFHSLDFNRDLDRIEAVIRERRPQYIVNFAAQSMVAQSWQHPDHWYQTNVVSTARLISPSRRRRSDSTPEARSATGCRSGFGQQSSSTSWSTPGALCDQNRSGFCR